MDQDHQDRTAIGLCRQGDPRGLGLLYERHGVRVYRLCLHLLGQTADAEDAAQEVFLRLWSKARLFRGESALSTWIYRLTTNHCLNRRPRRRAPIPLPELPETEHPPATQPGPDAACERGEDRQRLLELLDGLGPELRAILVLREIEQLSYQEIAAVLAIPIGTVMSRLSRARDRLRELVRPAREPANTRTRA